MSSMKYAIFLVVATFFVVATLAYDFKDADFNNYIFEEFQDVHSVDDDDTSSFRSRREAIEATSGTKSNEETKKECGRRDWKKDFQCCAGDKYNAKQHEAYMEAKKQCYAELRDENADDSFDPFDCERMQKVKEQMFCVSECVAKKFNFLAEDGALKRDVILAQVRTMIGETQWKQDASESIVDKCLAEVKEKRTKASLETTAETATAEQQQTKACNHCPLDFHYCMWREIASGCPAELRVDTPKCNRIRERLAKGYNPFIQKQFLHYLHERRREVE